MIPADIFQIGGCINSESHIDAAKCHCYKRVVPYTYLGLNGIFTMCRGWVDYYMLHSPQTITNVMSKELNAQYPQHNNDMVRKNSIGCYSGMFNFRVTPEPFQLYVSVSPSHFLRYVALPGWQIHNWSVWMPSRLIPDSLIHKCRKEILHLMYRNKMEISMVADGCRGGKGMQVKSTTKLLNELLTKINNYETV